MSDEGLGNIFDAVEGGDAPKAMRGPDLRLEIEYPRYALGSAEGFVAPVPRLVEQDGEEIERKIGPADDERGVRVHLPEGFQEGATLRLRGQGGVGPGGRAGDLYLTVRLVDVDPPPVLASPQAASSLPWVAIVALALGAAAVWFLVRP